MSGMTVSLEWEVLIATLSRAEELSAQFVLSGHMLETQRAAVVGEWQQRRDDYVRQAEAQAAVPHVSDILPLQPNELPTIRALRLWQFFASECARLHAAGLLTLAQAHSWNEEAKERMTSLRRRLAQDAVAIVLPRVASSAHESRTTTPPEGVNATSKETAEPPAFEAVESAPRRNFLEILLDPRSIQWLMSLGGALMVVGLVILLWINKFFTPPIMAVMMAATNVAVLVGGWATIRKTRYQLVGKGLTLLACLVMPLNLWYSHAHGLATVDGHLWVAAVVISGLYAASAWILKDELFVFVFCAGVALTGLLILADMHKFQEIAGPATLLVMLGLAAIHVERAFAVQDGPFSRQRFGLAFFASGHVLLASGLLLIFGTQLVGDWLYTGWFDSVYRDWHAEPSPICGEQRWLALVLVILGTYTYIYSDVVVRKHGGYTYLAAFTLLWAEVLLVQLQHWDIGVDAIIAVLAATSLLTHLVQVLVTRDHKMTRSFPVFGLLLGLLPVLLGTYEYLRFLGFREAWVGQVPRWSYVGAMILTAVAARVGAAMYRDSQKSLSTAYHFATAAATLVAAVAALAALSFEAWHEHAPILMLIPIAYLVASKLYGDRPTAQPLTWVAHSATVVMLISSIASAFSGFTQIVEGARLNLALAAFFAEAALFYGLATGFQRSTRFVPLATVMVCGSLWQLMTYCGFSADAYLLSFALVGFVLLLLYRFSVLEQTAAAPLAESAFIAANSLLSLAFVSAAMLGLSRQAAEALSSAHVIQWSFVGFSLSLLVIALLAAALVKSSAWRRWYVVNVVAQGALTLLAIRSLIDLNPWQQLELFSVVVGLALLAVGHWGWYREQDRESDFVSTSLFLGSLLVAVPLAIATWIDRGHGLFRIPNEGGFFLASILLLGSGVIFRLKCTTLIGCFSTVLYFATLLIFVPWSELNTVATLITVGGGILFGTGLALAFFRDRLLTLPDRVRNREGLFKVLNWR